jgi:PAS domain S-box-containing protein
MGRDPATAASRGRRDRLAAPVGVALAIAWVAIVTVVDIAVGDDAPALIGPLVAAPFITALLAGPLPTVASGVLAIAIAVISPAWTAESSGDQSYLVRLVVIALGAAFAVAAAWYRQRAAARAERLRLLDALGEVADGSLPLAETLRRVTDVLVPAVADICMIDSVHEGRVTRIAVRVAGREDAAELERLVMARPHSLPEWMVTAERSWRQIPRWRPRVRDEELRRMAHSPEDLELLRSLGLRSTINAPITARDRNLGVLTLIAAWSRRRYDADEVHFAQILASRIGLALDNAGLFSDLESFERRMDTVMSIIDEAVVIHGPDGELIFANPAAARAMGFGTVEEALGASAGEIGDRFTFRDESGAEIGPEALAGGRALGGEAPPPLTLRVTERSGGGERWLRTITRPITGPDGKVLYSVTVIEDVTEVKRAEFYERLLGRTGELISHTTDYARTLEEVARLLVPDFAEWCAVSIPRPNGAIEQVAIAHEDPEKARLGRELAERYPSRVEDGGPVVEAIETGRPRLMATIPDELVDARARDAEHLRRLRELGLRSAIVAPMVVGGRVVGALSFVNGPGWRTFEDTDVELAAAAARRAGLAIENARLAAERERVADALQRELLPPTVPALAGWEVETMYEPAGEVNDVGGDFYEVYPVDGGWAVLLGDVSGKGAAAASLTAEARHTIRTAGRLEPDPTAGLTVLDENLRRRSDAPLCSVAILVLPDPGEDPCEVYCYLAGHPNPLLVHGDEVVGIGNPGPALGVVAGATWEPDAVTVEAGDQIVLYTDGVIDARRRGGPRFGLERLREQVAGVSEPQLVVARVRAELEGFLSPETEDDAALVVIRRRAAGEPPTDIATAAAASAAGAVP